MWIEWMNQASAALPGCDDALFKNVWEKNQLLFDNIPNVGDSVDYFSARIRVGVQEARMVAVMTDTERRCGTCKFWVPEKEGLVERARAKYPWPHCELEKDKGIDGPKSADSKPCMVWMLKK